MRETIEAQITEQTVELFHRGTRVASHIRSPLRVRHTTVAEHMPSSQPTLPTGCGFLRRPDAAKSRRNGRVPRWMAVCSDQAAQINYSTA
jgi:hypothetical protein